MPRRPQIPQTYEEFRRGLAGYRQGDAIPLVAGSGEPLTRPQQHDVARRLGGRVIDDQVVLEPAVYGQRLEQREANVRRAIDEVAG